MASLRGLVLRRGAVIVLVGAVALAVVGLVVTRSLVDRLGSNSPCAVVTKPSFSKNRSPAQITAGSRVTAHFEYVVADCEIDVYDIDRGNRLVQRINLPQIDPSTHGFVASPQAGMLYISFGNQGPPGGSLLAYDLRRSRVVWRRDYRVGIDSMAISADGREIYMPAGEGSGDGTWRIIDARSGLPTGAAINAGAGAHNTIMGANGEHVYSLAWITRTSPLRARQARRWCERSGRSNGPGVRPFTINGSETLASSLPQGASSDSRSVASKAERCCTRFRCRDSPLIARPSSARRITASRSARRTRALPDRHPEWLRACL